MARTPEQRKIGGKRRKRGLTRADLELWRYVTHDVTPLADRPPVMPDVIPEQIPEVSEPPARRARAGTAARRPLLPPMPPPERPKMPEIGHGEVAGVDKRTAQRLRRGQLPIEARIDLHGLTQEEAHRALSSFLAGSQRAGRRCVLVVTGKGLKPNGETGVLRANVPRWLNTAPNRARILAFSYATRKDGGEGALYVLLRRK